MNRTTFLAILVLGSWGFCMAAEKSAIEKAQASLDSETFEFFKSQIKDKYSSHVRAFAIAEANIKTVKTAVYCPLRTSRCGKNPTCGHPKRKTTALDITIGKVLFKTGDGKLPEKFVNYTYFGKTSVNTGDNVVVSMYVYEKSPANIAKIKPAASKSTAGGRAINLKASDSGKTIKAAVGDLLIIELNAIPSTGFSWAAEDQVKESPLVMKSQKYEKMSQRNPEMAPMPGAGGFTIFKFQVVKPGKGKISLAYRQPWEKNKKPYKTFVVSVDASNKDAADGPTVTGKIIFQVPPDVAKISRVVVSIRNTALADGPAPLLGTIELKPPFKLPVTFAVPYDPAKVRPNPMFYSISARVYTLVGGKEKLYYINDTRHNIFTKEGDTKSDIKVKKLR